MLDFLQEHGDRVVKETPGPKKRSGALLNLYSMCYTNPSRHAEVMDHKSFKIEYQDFASCRFPSYEVCVCVYTLVLS